MSPDLQAAANPMLVILVRLKDRYNYYFEVIYFNHSLGDFVILSSFNAGGINL